MTGANWYRDRQGKQIDLLTWGRLQEDRSYKFLRETRLPDGREVITIWNGMTETACGPPMFSTGVFGKRDKTGKLGALVEEAPWNTEAEALAGHEQVVKKWSGVS